MLQVGDSHLPTAFPDHLSLLEILQQRFSGTGSEKTLTALLFIGFDDLSRFNATLGFSVDEDLMIKISQDIGRLLNRRDILAREGSHQLVIMQDNASTESAEDLAKRIMHMLSEPCVVDEQMFYIQASIGISLYPLDGTDPVQLIKSAKNTMKHVQKKNETHIGFTQNSTVLVPCKKNIRIMADMPAAIENGEIYFLYQPQYSYHEKRFVGAELLARWQHPEYGIISPEIFIPIAERSGMIGPLTIKALVTASKAFTLLKIHGMNNFSLSINISPVFLMASSFFETIDFLIEQYGLRNEKLNFEITEEILLKTTDNLIKILDKIKALEIGIELDDFGTGYTSLQHLAYLPINTLKIDKSFVTEIDKDIQKKALFKAIVDMSRALGINVIAEGIENKLENSIVETFETITAQGYFYSKPIDIDMLLEKLKS